MENKTVKKFIENSKELIANHDYSEDTEIFYDTTFDVKIKSIWISFDLKILFSDRFSEKLEGGFSNHSTLISYYGQNLILKFKGFYDASFGREIIITNLDHIPIYSFALDSDYRLLTYSKYYIDYDDLVEFVYYPKENHIDFSSLKLSEISMKLVENENRVRYAIKKPIHRALIQIFSKR